jgi:predicted nucleic acid-binding protein
VKVVVNATPLIALSLINQLELLNELFDEVLVPSAMYQEVVIQGAGQPGAAELASITWIQVQAPSTSSTIEPLLLGLDTGELQAIRFS